MIAESAQGLDSKWLARKEKVGPTTDASIPFWMVKEAPSQIWHRKGLRG